ncbi:MAG: relaxase domain-containing protein [bacterium]|nr:relaxase domain-containing protein [bacterium]
MVASIAQLTSAATSVSYYARDGQVQEDDPEHRLASNWYGKGARTLGLAGPVDAEPFQAVLEGHVPGTGVRLGSIRKGQHRHRPGVDLVFSAPKSVALEALFEGNDRVVEAHDHAAKATLGWIEERFLEARGFDRATGRRPRVRADHLVAATFRHVASRNHDPQIHTHCVIANMTRTHASRWRPVDATSLRRNRNLIGAFYRNVLAARLHDLGIVMVATMIGRVPGFEIAGYDQAFLDEFSSRRREILEHLDRLGLPRTSRAASLAALVTRRRKSDRNLDDLRREWRGRAARLV